MSFVIQRVVGRSVALTQVSAAVLRIGRGTNADLRSENPAVAFEHAVIETTLDAYVLTDKGSITGTYVNGATVETRQLKKGDVIEVGDLRAEVQLAEAGKPLFLKVMLASQATASAPAQDAAGPKGPVSTPGRAALAAPKIDFAKAYGLKRPYLTKISLAALLTVAAIGVIGEVTRPEKQRAFMPGGLSSAHGRARDTDGKSIAERCDACHTPWRSVTDAKCRDCHPQAPHSDQQIVEPACFACHGEHRGATRLAAIPESRCTSCHENLDPQMAALPQRAALKFAEGRYSYADIQSITSFGKSHPELVAPNDPSTLRFNHKLHLAERGVFNENGKREVLQCVQCHTLIENKGKADPTPLKFDKHCQRCHRLTFDARFPTAEVPHGGDPGLVYGFVLATYAGDQNLVGKSAVEVRRILTRRTAVTPDERAVLNAEQVIKTKCKLCHEIERRGERLAATVPVIRTEWFATAAFTHTRHRQIACEDCHAQARNSVLTSDVIMPKIKNCTECHSEGAGAKRAASACVACHLYHLGPRQKTPIVKAGLAGAGAPGEPGGGEMLQTILAMLVLLLLIVVLVPFGIALYQRTRSAPRDGDAAPPRAKPAPPPPLPPTAKVPPMQAPAPEAPRAASAPMPSAPRPAAPPAAEPTQMIDLGAKPKAPEPAGTEMLQWYGMLHCTAGPLEGQRFIVDDANGFYIGRDPELSRIVINDSRVSKRHVRIVPRDGKVWAIDQNSTNGTFIGAAGGQRITEVQLKRGDKLVLADNAATFVYQI